MKRLLNILLVLIIAISPITVFADKPHTYTVIENETSGIVEKGTEYGKDVYYLVGEDALKVALIGDSCFVMLRTTATQGVKMVYLGEASNGKCMSHVTNMIASNGRVDNTYAGYMHSDENQDTYEKTHENKYDSEVKTKTDNWFKTNMLDYIDYFEDTIYCNDRSVYPEDGSAVDDYWGISYSSGNIYSTGIGASATYYMVDARIEGYGLL